MKLIKPKAQLLIQPEGLEGIYKQIEKCGRTCYRSEDKITEDSAKPFVDRMINSNHLAMLEHGTVYLYYKSIGREALPFFNSPYAKVVTELCREVGTNGESVYEIFVTTNLRYIVENSLQRHLQYICEPTEYHEKRYTFRCITSIGVTREMNRHRVNSIAEQSTRYCNYSKEKFGGEITFCIPDWIDLPEGKAYYHDGINYRAGVKEEDPYDFVSINPTSLGDEKKATQYTYWLNALKYCEEDYFFLLKSGWQPQQAREVLPLCTATEIVHTAFASDWRHFFDLRYFGTTGRPHPNMLQLATLMKEEAEKHGIWNEISNSNK